MQGTVKFFNETKGFGFIKPSDSSEDIFVHSSGLIDDIHENDQVEYDMERGKKGMNAVNVRVID
ncbi:MAG: cold shock domain-containing protein [Cyclobacteriaceae bacterium]|jgi:CspA family cold shock protein|nr:cold shock domain-containing protein [Cyclobacteriaceae bacterium]